MIGYKYRGGSNLVTFNRDLDSIAGDYFYAAGLEKLNDPFEATFTKEPLERFIKLMALLPGGTQGAAKVRTSLEETLDKIKQVGVFSLAKNYDNTQLWSHYADKHTGFCVGYDVPMLERHNGDTYSVNYLVKVKYSQKVPTLGFDDIRGGVERFLQRTIGIKRSDWAHEAETRVVTDREGRIPHDFRAIKSVHFGLNMLPDQIKEVMQRMQGRQIAYYKMERGTNSYGLIAVPIEDMFANAPRYLYTIAPVTDYALATDPGDEERQQLLPYLQKAVEIQRREPYCSEVDYAGASTDKAKAGQIWVNYRYKGNYFNRHFTKAQIDELYAQITDL